MPALRWTAQAFGTAGSLYTESGPYSAEVWPDSFGTVTLQVYVNDVLRVRSTAPTMAEAKRTVRGIIGKQAR